MPQSNTRNRNRCRRNRKRRRFHQPATVAQSSTDNEHKKLKETPDAVIPRDKYNDNDDNDDDSKTNEDDFILENSVSVCEHGESRIQLDDRCKIEKVNLESHPRLIDIITISSLPLEATIGHIAGVGILETGISSKLTKDFTKVTISEPVESIRPFPDYATVKCDPSSNNQTSWIKRNRLKIHEVDDINDEETNKYIPMIEKSECDDETKSHEERYLKKQRVPMLKNNIESQSMPQKKGFKLGATEASTLTWDSVMPKEVERKLRNFIEDLQLPSFSEEVMEEEDLSLKEFFVEENSSEKVITSPRRKAARKRAISESHCGNSFLDIIKEEGEKLSDDETQYIRDFINEEISKYRREDRHANGQKMADDAETKRNDPEETEISVEKRKCDINIDTPLNNISESHLCNTINNRSEFGIKIDSSFAEENVEDSEVSDITTMTMTMAANEEMETNSSSNESMEILLNTTRDNCIIPEQINLVQNNANIEKFEDSGLQSVQQDMIAVTSIEQMENNKIITKNDTNLNEAKNKKNETEILEDSDKLRCTLQVEISSVSKQQPPPLPKRSSSLNYEPQRPPMPSEIDYLSNHRNICRPFIVENDKRPDSMHLLLQQYGNFEIEAVNEPPVRPKLPEDKNLSTISNNENDSLTSLAPSDVIIYTNETHKNVHQIKQVLIEDSHLIASSDIRDDDPSCLRDAGDVGMSNVALANATSTEITHCEEGKPVTLGAQVAYHRSASSNRQEDKAEISTSSTDKKDSRKEDSHINEDIIVQAEVLKLEESCIYFNSVPEDKSIMGQRLSNNKKKPREEEKSGENSTSIVHLEQLMKNGSSEMSITQQYKEIERNREDMHEEMSNSCRQSNAGSSPDDETRRIDTQETDIVANINPLSDNEAIDVPGYDSSSSTTSLNTVKYHPLESSLTDINTIIQEIKGNKSDVNESLQQECMLLKTEKSTGEFPEKDSESDIQTLPYSSVENLNYMPGIASDVFSSENLDDISHYEIKQPSTLKELCVKKILSIPLEPQVTRDIITSKLNNLESLHISQRFMNNTQLNQHAVSDRQPNYTTGLTKMLGESESLRSNDPENTVSDRDTLLEKVNIEDQLSKLQCEMEQRWKGLSTSQDPRVLICLSPSQQATSFHTNADVLLDLHQKFLNRYSYCKEQPHNIPVPKYRVQIHPSRIKENDDVISEIPKLPTRNLYRDSNRKSSNRLLEIIKEHSPHDSGFQNDMTVDHRSKKITVDASDILDKDQQHLKMKHLNECLNQTRHDCRSTTVNELLIETMRDKNGHDDKSSNVTQGDQPRTLFIGHWLPSKAENFPPDSEKSETVSTRLAKTPISSNSIIIDRLPDSTMEAGKKVNWKAIDSSKHVNPALIDDKLSVSSSPKRTVMVDRSCIDTTSIFDQNPPKNHLRPRNNHQATEKLKHVAAVEIMQKLKKLQTETLRQLDDDKKNSPTQDYYTQQLKYIELLEDQLKNVILAEEEEKKAIEEFRICAYRIKELTDAIKSSGSNTTEKLSNKARIDFRDEHKFPIDICNEKTREKAIKNIGQKEYRSPEKDNLKKIDGDETQIQKENWHEKTENVEKIHHESKIEPPKYPVIKEDTVISENATFKKYENNVSHQEEPKHTIKPKKNSEMFVVRTTQSNFDKNIDVKRPPIILPTNVETFRQRMYDEYVNEVLERQERKNHKVVKISSHEDIHRTNNKLNDMGAVAKEFIEKARSRLCKFGIDLDENETDYEEQERREDNETISGKCLIDGKELEDARKLPEHLREFLRISTMSNEGGNSYDIPVKRRGNEGNLLHEIDKALKISKGFLLQQENVMFAPTFKASSAKPGVWSPGQTPPIKQLSPERTKEVQQDKVIPSVWTPASAGASPAAEKKEFRPVSFESPILSRKKQPKKQEAPPPWENEEENKQNSQSAYEYSSSRIVNSHSAPSQGLSIFASTPRLPRAQNPTITLLQKAREGQLPKGAAYLEESEFIDNRPSSDERPFLSPGEIIYTLKKEYESEPETDNELPKKMADLGPRKFEGIGPVTREGIPLVLRSEVKENNQTKWYKQMYDSLHRTGRDDDYVTIRYKPRRGEYTSLRMTPG